MRRREPLVRRAVWFATIAAALLTAAPQRGVTAIPAGTLIANQATLTYTDARHVAFSSSSNQVSVSAAPVSALSMTPNEDGCNAAADAIAAGSTFSRTFSLVNGGNGPDSIAVVAASTSAGRITGTLFQAGASAGSAPGNAQQSAVIPPGGSIAVVVTVDASGVPSGTQMRVRLTVRTTGAAQNGTSSATAVQCALAAPPPQLSGSTGSGSSIVKVVNGAPASQAAPGSTVTYAITFKNYGGAPASAVVVDDDLPAGIAPVARSVTLNGQPLSAANVTQSGQVVHVAIGDVAPNSVSIVTLAGRVTGAYTAGSVAVNVAKVSGANLEAALTSPAALMIGSSNIVFDGAVGQSAPLTGVAIALVADAASGRPSTTAVTLDGPPVAPNLGRLNPYITAAGGGYAMEIAPVDGPQRYDLIVSAKDYVTRRIRIELTPDPTHSYDRMTATALDSQPLTAPGSFTLQSAPVTIAATSGLFGNVPMFHVQSLAASKSVNRDTASAGDRLIYTIAVGNNGPALGMTSIVDALPAGESYAADTALIDGLHVEPVRAGSNLRWNLPNLAAPHTIVFAAVVLPGAGDGVSLTNTVAVSAHVLTSGTFTLNAGASATTKIIAGLFSNRTVITGRVYVDKDDSGWFKRGDAGVAGVRIFLEDGESVTTDRDGKFDFPGVRPGRHVICLDETSLPADVHASWDRRIDHERSSRRLITDAFGGGLLHDINFAVGTGTR